jgi:hypothetical protein
MPRDVCLASLAELFYLYYPINANSLHNLCALPHHAPVRFTLHTRCDRLSSRHAYRSESLAACKPLSTDPSRFRKAHLASLFLGLFAPHFTADFALNQVAIARRLRQERTAAAMSLRQARRTSSGSRRQSSTTSAPRLALTSPCGPA